MYPNEKFFAHSERFDSGHLGSWKSFQLFVGGCLKFFSTVLSKVL